MIVLPLFGDDSFENGSLVKIYLCDLRRICVEIPRNVRIIDGV